MITGGISQADPSDQTAIEAISLAVKKHNTDTNENLEFQKIVELTSQVVAGTRFRATIECLQNGEAKQFDIDLWCKPGQDYPKNFEIMSFQAK